MIARCLTPLLQQRLKHFPAVALVGPRQGAKTTLAQSMGRHYFNLENPAERTRPDATWAAAPGWEGFVIEQVLSFRAAQGESFGASFFRSHDGYEADRVLECGEDREVIEIKVTSSPAPEDLARLGRVAELVGATRQTLLCRVANSVTEGPRWVTNLKDYLKAHE